MNDDYNPLNNDLLTTGVYYKIHDAVFKKKMQHIIMPGSARSSKTHSAMQFIINYILQSKVPLKCAIMRYRVTWLKESTLPDFIKIMSQPRPHGFGVWNSNSYNKTDRVYTFDNGSTLKFAALADDAGRKMAHGFESDVLYLNECLDLQWEPVDQLQMRNKKFIIYDFNPGMSEKHWIYTKIANRPTSTIIHSTFRDNPFCPEKERASILAYEPTEENIRNGTADETSWKIYGLGVRAEVKGLIYPLFKVIPNMPKKFDKDGYGLDFGFTNDPTGFVHCGIIDKTLYLDELVYKTELVNLKHLGNTKQRSIEGEFELLKVDRLKKIWADSAEPKSIQDLKNAGYNVDGAKKHGINYSILDGINAVKRFDMYVTERSIHLIKELENYKWKDNSRGDSALNTPIDNWNHCIAKGTLITTAKGDIPIEDVKVNDYVLTRKGFRRVTESWCSGKNQYVSRIVTNDSHLDATGNHKIFIHKKDFVPLENLMLCDMVLYINKKDLICHTQKLKSKYLTEQPIDDIPMPKGEMIESITYHMMAIRDYIEKYGNTIKATYPRDTTYITKIRIHLIMILKILNAFKVEDICKFIQEIENTILKSLHNIENLLKFGTHPQKVLLGILNMVRKYFLTCHIRNMYVNNVEHPIKAKTLKQEQNSVLINASQHGEENQKLMMLLKYVNVVGNHFRVINTTNSNFVPITALYHNVRKTDVYDLNIEDEHEFFANGILVHNCLDAVRYWCIMSEPDAGFYKESFKLDTVERVSGSSAYDIWSAKQGDDSDDD